MFKRKSLSISFGIPTKPSSFFSGIILIIFPSLGVTDCALAWLSFIFFNISKFNSNKASSTIFIVFSSVTLKPFINFESIFCSSSFALIFLPPPWTTIEENPNLLTIDI